MNLTNSVLLPVDLQQAFDASPWPRRWNEAVDANGQALLKAWREHGLPIIHIRHDSVAAGSTLAPGASGNGFRPGFGPVGDEPLVTKSVNAAFIGTDLDLRLRRLGVNTLVVFGIATDMCVSTTVRVGANLGYNMILVEDACDCFDLPDGKGGTIPAETIHAAHVASLRREFADVTTTKAALEALKTVTPAAA